MPYVRLLLSDSKASAAISMATERHLEQVHYLLAATYPNGKELHHHFGTSAAVMTLLTIAAASAIRHFDPKKNKKPRVPTDHDIFTDAVMKFFPWGHISIQDDQFRSLGEQRKAAAEELYSVFRNPLVHLGGITSKPQMSGVVGGWYRSPEIAHVFPGLSQQENEAAIENYCQATLSGDLLIKLEALSSTVYTRPLYWCTRKMIEAFAADSDVQADINRNLAI